MKAHRDQQGTVMSSEKSSPRCSDCAMRAYGIFKDVPQEVFESIVCCMTNYKFPARHVIFLEGNPCNQIASIRKGIIKLSKCGANGKWQNVGMLGPGFLLGYEGFLDRPFQSTAEAITEVELCMAPHDEIVGQLRQFPDMTIGLVGLLCHRIGELELKALQLGAFSGRQRLAAYLLASCDSNGDRDNPGGVMAIQSRQEIAETLGMAKETVIRLLAKFAEHQIIDMNRSNITINDSRKLAQILSASI
jgi:CRP/FNR family transcriptional regulator